MTAANHNADCVVTVPLYASNKLPAGWVQVPAAGFVSQHNQPDAETQGGGATWGGGVAWRRGNPCITLCSQCTRHCHAVLGGTMLALLLLLLMQ